MKEANWVGGSITYDSPCQLSTHTQLLNSSEISSDLTKVSILPVKDERYVNNAHIHPNILHGQYIQF